MRRPACRGREQPGAAAALAGHALHVAEQAAAGMQTSAGEVAAARWLDAEDAAAHQGLAWALEHDRAAALRLAIALAPWWHLRGRFVAGSALLRAAAEDAARDGDAWLAAQLWLGRAAVGTGDFVGALGHFTAVRDAVADRGPSPSLVDALTGRSSALRNLDRIPEAAEDGRRALAAAREIGYPAGEARALGAWASRLPTPATSGTRWPGRGKPSGSTWRASPAGRTSVQPIPDGRPARGRRGGCRPA